MKVFVYRNLRKNCYSIKALEGAMKGKVIAHAKTVTLTECRFKVSKAGQARVRATGQKNVHAGVQGQWDGIAHSMDVPDECNRTVYYNPYKVDTFVEYLTERPVEGAGTVYLGLTGVFADNLK
jgi:hypothetical protein